MLQNPLKLVSWNVNGLLAANKSAALPQYARSEVPDVLCLQETRLTTLKSTEVLGKLLGNAYPFEFHSCCVAGRQGYSGVAVYSKIEPRGVHYGIGKEEFDCEGRTITLDLGSFYLVCTYVPNAGEAQKRMDYRLRWNDALISFLHNLGSHNIFKPTQLGATNKGIVLCGDLNVAHQDIDIHSPATLHTSSGFTPEERAGFTTLLSSLDLVDVYRHHNPDTKCYTFWSYRGRARQNDRGWRLDYFLVQRKMLSRVVLPFVQKEVKGSDHCPIGILFQQV